jgi:predicted nucleic acid-binding protein
MSLKAMHILFVSCSIALAFCFGAWLLNDYSASHDRTEMTLGVISCGVGVLLLVYAKAILRKLRQISFL